ncbi:hypothetical protein NDU88_003831 [Pleurodeles waltl]|uniref:Uncharacterized protein n=1 Tax=Pleurodeles waltl TaxID=8319 RepID=A0AAV7RFC7_PLEWA|nr:hypothetical protein NDU88_003831 [Pleurodeles waltl]
MIAGSPDTITMFSGQYAVRRLGGRCAARGAVHRLVRLAATQATFQRPLSCLLLAGYSTRTGVAALLGWFFDGATKTSRIVRGKPSLEVTAVRREKKQLAAPLKDRTSAQGKGAQQSASAMEKSLGKPAQVPAMFKQIGRIKRTPPPKGTM